LGASIGANTTGCLSVGPNQTGKGTNENLNSDGLFVNPGTNDNSNPSGAPTGFQMGGVSVAWKVTSSGGVYTYTYTFSNANTSENISHIILGLGSSLCTSATTANDPTQCIYNLQTDSTDTTGINKGFGACATPYSCNAADGGTGFFDAANPISGDSGTGTSNPRLPAGFATTAFQLEPVFPSSNPTGTFTLQFNSLTAPAWQNVYIRDDQSQNDTTSVEAWNNTCLNVIGACTPFYIPAPGIVINTSQQPASAVVGTSIADKATVTGGITPYSAGDTVTFNLYSSATTQNASTLLFTDTEPLSGGTATSKGFLTTATGTVYWVATFNGDSNNSAVSSGASAEPVVITPAGPTISKSFSPSTILPGGTSTLSITLTNPNTATALTNASFSDTFPTVPAGLTVTASPTTTVNCTAGTTGASLTANAGATSISFSATSLPANGNCVITVTVTATPDNSYPNSTGAPTSTNGGSGTAASATLIAVKEPVLTKAFGGSIVSFGGSTTLTFTLSNPNANTTLTLLGFSDPLPNGLVVGTPNGLTPTTCGGVNIVANPGAGTVSVTGATLTAGTNCTFTVNVSPTGAVTGPVTNTTGTVSATPSVANGAAAVANIFISGIAGTTASPASGAFPSGANQASLDPGAQQRYVANLNIGDSYIDFTNTGVNGNNPLGPGVGTTGNMCVNVYAFDPNEELIACCSCLVTPDQTVSLSVNTNINAHSTEAGLTSLTVKLVSVSPLVVSSTNPSLTNCTNSAAGFVNVVVGGALITTPTATLQTGLAAWGTTVHSGPTAGLFSETETAFTPFTLSASEASSIFGRCAAIIGNLSGNGICSTCKAGSITSSGLGTGQGLTQ
jgi:fimbrial isopeptide formation D2 family protein